MKVQIVSNTVQKFNGESYYFCGNYFQRKGRRLHREVWKHHNGEIPKGYHVHHIDGDRTNNQIENLKLMLAKDHMSKHNNTPERKEFSRKAIENARTYASKWHGSSEGIDYHSKLGKENWKKRKMNTYVCTECGKTFQTKHVYGEDQNRFCHQNCRARYGHRKRKAEQSENQKH